MRAMDCKDPAKHEDMHFTGENDDELFAQVKQHAAEHHPEMNDDQIREVMASNAYDE